MKELKEYIVVDQVNDQSDINEGFLANGISKIILNKISQQELLDGILNMYDYIVDKDDIKLFLQDFPLKERVFWKNLYDLQQKKVWSIIDVDGNYEDLKSMIPEFNQIVDITVPFRRELRQIIKQSRNTELDLKPSEPKSMMAVQDNLLKDSTKKKNKVYVFTINRVTGPLKRLFRAIDAKFLEHVFKKIGGR